jgi:hypothetical protein
MSAKHRWAWFLLAVLCATAIAWTRRNEYAACDTDGCVEINRWTGSIAFREIEWSDDAAPDRQMVAAGPRRTARPNPHPTSTR